MRKNIAATFEERRKHGASKNRKCKAQKEEAERNGDFFLARLFNRVPEHYIGVISGKDEDRPSTCPSS